MSLEEEYPKAAWYGQLYCQQVSIKVPGGEGIETLSFSMSTGSLKHLHTIFHTILRFLKAKTFAQDTSDEGNMTYSICFKRLLLCCWATWRSVKVWLSFRQLPWQSWHSSMSLLSAANPAFYLDRRICSFRVLVAVTTPWNYATARTSILKLFVKRSTGVLEKLHNPQKCVHQWPKMDRRHQSKWVSVFFKPCGSSRGSQLLLTINFVCKCWQWHGHFKRSEWSHLKVPRCTAKSFPK